MTDTANIQNPLELAEAELREICERQAQFEKPIDTGSLGRMMTHIRNINRSVAESTRDHVNAAKRLTDFAVTLGRIAKQSVPTSEELAQRIRNLVQILQATGEELASATTTPKWAQPSAS